MTLLALLKARIAREGPITVADYMEAALAHPTFGYYMTRDPFGVDGDFTTAPEISQLFGELIGAWLAHAWLRLGSPPRCALLELGPGRGTLMQDVLRATRAVPGFHAALFIYMLEASPVLEARQRHSLKGAHSRMYWVSQLSNLVDIPLLFIANEFFDALPIHQFIHSGDAWEKQTIGLKDGSLAFTLPPGQTRERCEAGEAIIGLLAAHLARHGGAGLVIDYGYTGGTNGDTLQAVRRHAYCPPLETPGEADLTAHVDFSALAACATAHGAIIHGPTPQGAFLQRLGVELRAAQLCAHANGAQRAQIASGVERLILPSEMGELFKVMALSHPALTALEGF